MNCPYKFVRVCENLKLSSTLKPKVSLFLSQSAAENQANQEGICMYRGEIRLVFSKIWVYLDFPSRENANGQSSLKATWAAWYSKAVKATVCILQSITLFVISGTRLDHVIVLQLVASMHRCFFTETMPCFDIFDVLYAVVSECSFNTVTFGNYSSGNDTDWHVLPVSSWKDFGKSFATALRC